MINGKIFHLMLACTQKKILVHNVQLLQTNEYTRFFYRQVYYCATSGTRGKKKIIKKIKKNSAQGMAKLNTAFQQVIYLSLLSTRNQQCYPLFLSQQIFFIGLTRFT